MRDIPNTIKLDHTNLCPEIPTDKRFNGSLIESGDGYLVAFRDNWKDSRIACCWLNKDFAPTVHWRYIDLPDIPPARAHEDPRLFRIGTNLYLSYTGFNGKWNTTVLFAEIDELELTVKKHYWPQWVGSNRKEKNWQPFDYQGIVHFVYSINPHVILKVPEPAQGEDPWAEWICNTPFKGTWSGGFMRGGASPVLHNGEWYSFFHGSIDREPPHRRRLYNMGVYTFSPNPPFQILRYTPEPIAWADPEATPKDAPVDVIFPAGAVFADGRWCVSMGVGDYHTELRFYDESFIEGRLVKHGND